MKTKVKGIKIYRTEMKVYKIGIFKWTLHKMVGIPGGFWGLAGVSCLWRNSAVCGLKENKLCSFLPN